MIGRETSAYPSTAVVVASSIASTPSTIALLTPMAASSAPRGASRPLILCLNIYFYIPTTKSKHAKSIPKDLSLSPHLSLSLLLGICSLKSFLKLIGQCSISHLLQPIMKTYLKHSSPPMPGDCLTPLVESWTLNLFPFSSAPCNSRSKSLIFPRPGNKWLIVFWNGLLTHPSINVDKAKVFVGHNIGLDNSAIALKQRPEFGNGYIVWFKLTMIWVSRAFMSLWIEGSPNSPLSPFKAKSAEPIP